jgi:sideroflexin-5
VEGCRCWWLSWGLDTLSGMATTYWERFGEMWYQSGPGSWPLLFADVEEAKAIVSEGDKGGHDAATLERATRVLRAAVHVDTGQTIPLPFRMAAHVPMNTLILMGMLSSHGRAATMAWQVRSLFLPPRAYPLCNISSHTTPRHVSAVQVVNSTFNALQFRANANHSFDVPDARLLASYVGSVASAGGVAWWLRSWEQRAGRSRFALVSLLVPFIAAAAGKPLQIGLMRSNELTDGIKVYGADGDVVVDAATKEPLASRRAGVIAVAATTSTRILYLAQPIIIPALLFASMERRWPLARHPLYFLFRVLFIASMSAVATPMCIALFDQSMSVPTAWLEPEVAANTASPRVSFNRGL